LANNISYLIFHQSIFNFPFKQVLQELGTSHLDGIVSRAFAQSAKGSIPSWVKSKSERKREKT